VRLVLIYLNAQSDEGTEFERDRFRTIIIEDGGYILLCGTDGGILGYIVPVEYMMEDGDYMVRFRRMLEELSRLMKSENIVNRDMNRGLQSSRCYCIWYAMGRNLCVVVTISRMGIVQSDLSKI
jgi:hypothetical protein